jgi:TRAP-type C4-dicarboxylate transport system permease small subunit
MIPSSSPLQKVWTFLNRLEAYLLAFFLAAMLFLGLLQILFRNLLSISLFWIDPLLRHLVLWVALLGASAATGQDRHISIDLLSGRLPPRARSWLFAGIYLISAGVCFLLVMPAVRFVRSEYEVGKPLALGLPIWVSQAIIPVMLSVMGLRFLAKLPSLVKKKGPPSAPTANVL